MAASCRLPRKRRGRNNFNRIHNGSITVRLLLLSCFVFIAQSATAQTDSIPVFKNATAANRAKTYSNIVKNIITKNLSLPLTDSTEENWQDAFYAMEVLRYNQPWVEQKVKTAFEGIEKRSAGFQRALLELACTQHLTQFTENIHLLFMHTNYAKVYAMCAAFLLEADSSKKNKALISHEIFYKDTGYFENPLLSDYFKSQIVRNIIYDLPQEKISEKRKVLLNFFFSNSLLPGNIVAYSIQRKNRNYPGIIIIRDSAGNFIKDTEGNIFSVPQLARSITNLPGYLTNGNTPQGIFRMNGFAVSKSDAIGPTENIQLMMPYETSPQFFLKDSSITDTVWTKDLYQRLLPDALKNYHSLFGSYYASACGRTEIIAHGTTVDPDYYRGQIYFPFTPTQGCLCTKEIWSDVNGKRNISDQQKLVDAVKKAGGANGYLVVIELDDSQKPVTIEDILPYLPNYK